LRTACPRASRASGKNLEESVSKCKKFIDTVSFGFFLLFLVSYFLFRKNSELAEPFIQKIHTDNFPLAGRKTWL